MRLGREVPKNIAESLSNIKKEKDFRPPSQDSFIVYYLIIVLWNIINYPRSKKHDSRKDSFTSHLLMEATFSGLILNKLQIIGVRRVAFVVIDSS